MKQNRKKSTVNADFLKKQVQVALEGKKREDLFDDFDQNDFFKSLHPQIRKNWAKMPKDLKKSIISINTKDKKNNFYGDSDQSLFFILMNTQTEDKKPIEEGFLDNLSDIGDGVKDFFRGAGETVVNYARNPSEAKEDFFDFWGGVGKQTLNSTRNAIRWSKSKFYSNNQQMSISNIESSDPDVDFIKHFFALYGEINFESGKFTSIFPNSLEIENPDNYSLYGGMTSDINKWFSENRAGFIHKFAEESEKEGKIDIALDYFEDFSGSFGDSESRFSFFGLGSKEIMIDSNKSEKIIKNIIENEAWALGDPEKQNSREIPCILDIFPLFFKFLYDLDYKMRGDMSKSNYARAAKRVMGARTPAEFLENEKDYLFLRLLRKSETFRKKWSGYCLASAFDPDGKWPLSWWTDNSDKFKEKSEESKAQFIGKISAKIGGLIARQSLAIRAAKGVYQRAAGMAASGYWSCGITILIIGIDLLISFDPFEWFSIRDDVEEEFIKMRDTIDKLIDLTENKSLSKAKLEGIKEKFSSSSLMISKLIHGAMLAGLQKNVEDPEQDMNQKKLILFLLSDNITTIKQITNSFNINPYQDLDVKKLKFIKKQIEKLIIEVSKEEKSTKGTKSAIDKITPNLKRGISGAENMFESKLIVESSFDSSFEEFNKKFKDLFDFEIKGDGSDLKNARKIKERFNSRTNSGGGLSDIMKNPDAEIINSAARFERWWDQQTSGDALKIKSSDVAEKTFFHVKWARGRNGLCSELFPKNYFTDEAARTWQAWSAIGPGHALANTCFLYLPYRGGPGKELKLRSKVQIEDGKVFLINVGIRIQLLESILKEEFVGKINRSFIKSEYSKTKNFINSLVQKINKTPDGTETNKLMAANILATLYSRRFLEDGKTSNGQSAGVYNQLNEIISLDRQLTARMKQKANELANLSPGQQNPNPMHSSLMKDLRSSATLKIMLFTALMKGIV